MSTGNNASFSFRLSDGLKKQSFGIIEEYGLTPSQAINLFLTQIVATKSIPVSLDYLQPNAVTLRAVEEIESGKVEKISVEDMGVIETLKKQADV